MKNGGLVHTVWWHCSDRGLSWLWRPYCWVRGYHEPHHCDVYFELCSMCGKTLWTRGGGIPNPFVLRGVSGPDRLVERAPIRGRPR